MNWSSHSILFGFVFDCLGCWLWPFSAMSSLIFLGFVAFSLIHGLFGLISFIRFSISPSFWFMSFSIGYTACCQDWTGPDSVQSRSGPGSDRSGPVWTESQSVRSSVLPLAFFRFSIQPVRSDPGPMNTPIFRYIPHHFTSKLSSKVNVPSCSLPWS